MELTAWVERTRSDRGVAGGDDSCTRMGQERFQFHPILPIQGFLNLRFVQSQNIPEPGAFFLFLLGKGSGPRD